MHTVMISYSQAQSRAARIDGKPSICIFKMGSSLIPKKLATNCDGVAMTDVPQKLFWGDVSLPDAPCPHIAGNDTGAWQVPCCGRVTAWEQTTRHANVHVHVYGRRPGAASERNEASLRGDAVSVGAVKRARGALGK